MPTIVKKDWASWRDGMRSKMFKAGAESLSTNIGAMLATNGIATMGIPGLGDIGLNWKTALCTTAIQFLLRVFLAGANYVAQKPDPDAVAEIIDTQILTKKAEISTLQETKESIKP